MSLLVRISALLLSWVLTVGFSSAATLDDIGVTRLRNELGASLATGSGVIVAQSEATQLGFNYPNRGLAEFSGKTFTNGSGAQPGGSSQHATDVARNFYGNTSSPAPGITQITNYTADGWLNNDVLRAGTGSPPQIISARVTNHSWIAPSGGTSTNTLQRMDYLAEVDDMIHVAGLANTAGATTNPIFANAMNILLVGNTNGNHSTGTSSGTGLPYTTGRTRPHLTVPGVTATSFAAPHVAGSAAVLVGLAHTQTGLSNDAVNSSVGRNNYTLRSGETSESIRALLLAGGDRKAAFPVGDPYTVNTSDGLSNKYGAGELDLYNSYRMLAAGEHNNRQTGNLTELDLYGWDYEGSFVASTPRTYRLTIPTGYNREFVASLVWNLDIVDPVAGTTPTLRNLNLRLRNLGDSSIVASSTSTGDVMENIYLPSLGAGQYELEVSATGFVVPFTTEFALAWRFTPTTTPLAGDVNLDGRVSLADLSSLQSHLGQTSRVVWTDGDLNLDGKVDRTDLVRIVMNLGRNNGVASPDAELFDAALAELMAPGAILGPTPVPEPTTVALTAIGLAVLGFRRNLRRSSTKISRELFQRQ